MKPRRGLFLLKLGNRRWWDLLKLLLMRNQVQVQLELRRLKVLSEHLKMGLTLDKLVLWLVLM